MGLETSLKRMTELNYRICRYSLWALIPKRNDLELYDYQNWMNQIIIILSSGTFLVIFKNDKGSDFE